MTWRRFLRAVLVVVSLSYAASAVAVEYVPGFSAAVKALGTCLSVAGTTVTVSCTSAFGTQTITGTPTWSSAQTFPGLTLSGTISGTPTWASAQTLPGLTLTDTLVMGGRAITGIDDTSTVNLGSSSSTGTLCAVANVNTTAVGNVGAGEDDLMTYSLPANTLTATTRVIRVTAWFTTAANGNTKSFAAYWGAASLTIVTAAAWSGQTAFATLYIIRTGANTQDFYLHGGDAAGPTFRMPLRTTATETESGAVTLKFTGESGSSATDDAVNRFMMVEVCHG